MDGREEELKNSMVFVEHMFGIRLRSANDPKAALFGFFKGVYAPFEQRKLFVPEDDLNSHRRLACTTMDYLCAKCILETQEEMVKNRVDFAVLCLRNRYFRYFYGHFLKSRDNIHSIL